MNKPEDIKIVILAGSRDFGRCPLASRLPVSLWPVAGKSAIEHLLVHLAEEGISQVTICSNGDALQLKESIAPISSIEIKFMDEALPVGTAGCIRDAAKDSAEELIIVFPAGIVSPPAIDEMLDEHRKADSDMTIMFNPSVDNDGLLHDSAQIYICRRSVLEIIPDVGYYDIKESLIPEMLRAGKTIRAGKISQDVGNFRSWPEYLKAIGGLLENANTESPLLSGYKKDGSKNVWLGNDVNIDDSARILGPVIIGDQTKISEDVVILGPAVIGCNVTVGRGALITNSVIFDGTSVGSNCQINDSVVDYNTAISDNRIIGNQVVATKQNYLNKAAGILSRKLSQMHTYMQTLFNKINSKLPSWAQHSANRFGILHAIGAIALFVVFIWSYWPTIADLLEIWQGSDEYSSGLLVPFLAVYILWSRRHKIAESRIKPSMWGLAAFAGAQAFRLFGLFFMYGSAERLSLVFSIISLVLLLFGWDAIRKTYSVLLFLFLMLPLPARVHASIMLPLQKLATTSAVFCLEMTGYTVIREGNIIHLNGTTVAVAEACNGLRMVTAFIIIISLVVLIVNRPFWEKLIVLISSLPIALLCNTIRLTVTAIAFTFLTGEKWEAIFHNWGGYAMMPVALLIVVTELWLLKNLTTPPEKKKGLIIKCTNRL